MIISYFRKYLFVLMLLTLVLPINPILLFNSDNTLNRDLYSNKLVRKFFSGLGLATLGYSTLITSTISSPLIFAANNYGIFNGISALKAAGIFGLYTAIVGEQLCEYFCKNQELLWQSIVSGDKEKVRFTLSNGAILLDNAHHHTLLRSIIPAPDKFFSEYNATIQAASRNHMEIVKILAANGVDIASSFQLACESDTRDAVRNFIRHRDFTIPNQLERNSYNNLGKKIFEIEKANYAVQLKEVLDDSMPIPPEINNIILDLLIDFAPQKLEHKRRLLKVEPILSLILKHKKQFKPDEYYEKNQKLNQGFYKEIGLH